MEHLNCRGAETREKIVRLYDIKLIIYAKLLNGKTKHSDAHETLTDRYYEFECTLKSNKNVIKAITCGSGVGEHLLELANIKRPPIFNPFKSQNIDTHGGNTYNNGSNTNEKVWNPLAKELYDAIRWLICCWDVVPHGDLLKIKEGLEEYYYNEPFLRKIIHVNNIIHKDKKERTISKMIDEVREVGNDVREYRFNLINKMLEEKGVESYY